MRFPRLLAPVASLLLTGASSLAAQATMTGVVREDSSARPIEGVEVLINGTAHRGTTNAAGRYLLEGLPSGVYQAIFRAVGHLPLRMDVRLVDAETTRANATLVRSDVVLDPIVVTGEAMPDVGLAGPGFEERRRMGFGRFVLPEEMRRSEHMGLNDVLRRQGVNVMLTSDGRWIPMHPTSRDINGAPNCQMSVYLDGILVHKGGRYGASDFDEDLDLRKFFTISELTAIEIYSRASQIPIQFSGAQASCGVIVLWSRRGP